MIDKVKKTIEKYELFDKKDVILVGVSGGPDSISLLHILYELGYNIKVAHVNHGIRENASNDEQYVKDFCAERQIPCFVKSVHLKEMESKMSGLIIDLRNNPGGLLDIASRVIDKIIPEGIITYTVDKNGNKDFINSNEESISIPVVVLVNENSASAAEITAAAIKDWDNGTVVGTKTFGKGLVQVLKSLGDGTYVKITICEYFSPSGEKINEIGVLPDYEIEDDEDTEEDEQLQKAIEVIKEKIK